MPAKVRVSLSIDASQASTALFIRGLPKAKVSQLKKLAASHKKLQKKKREKEFIAAALGEKNRPPLIIKALQTNPVGRLRQRLLDAACRTAANAGKVLTSDAQLTLKERIRLAHRAIASGKSNDRSERAAVCLKWHKDWPADIRALLVRTAASGGRHWNGASYILWDPDKYFPAESPMTQAERAMLIRKYLADGRECADILVDYGLNMDAHHRRSFSVTEQEVKEAIPRAIEYICSGNLKTHYDPTQAILTNHAAVKLLSKEQVEALQARLPKVA